MPKIRESEMPKEIWDGGIIHWIYDASTPRSPPMAIMPKPERYRQWAESAGFIFEQDSI